MSLPSDYTAIYTLYKYIKSKVPVGIKVINGWPNSNENLGERAISMRLSGDNAFTLHPATLLNTVEIDGDDINETARYKIGYNDLIISVDCWGLSKEKRSIVASEFRKAFLDKVISTDTTNTDLQLPLLQYFDEVVKYDILSSKEINDESTTQRNEWRTIITLSCGFEEVIEKVMPKMTDIQVQLEVSTSSIGGV